MNRHLIKLLKDKNILKSGNFILRSGKQSDYYCDIKEALGYPEVLNMLVTELIKLVPTNATCIAGCGYGGITLASLVAYKKKIPLVLVRDKIKNHGTKKIIDGYTPNKKDVVCIIDDVFTTGSSIKDTKEKLAYLKSKFTKPVVVLNRSRKSVVISILTDKNLSGKNTSLRTQIKY